MDAGYLVFASKIGPEWAIKTFSVLLGTVIISVLNRIFRQHFILIQYQSSVINRLSRTPRSSEEANTNQKFVLNTVQNRSSNNEN